MSCFRVLTALAFAGLLALATRGATVARVYAAPLPVALGGVQVAAQDTTRGVVHGQVLSAESGGPLPYALVELVAGSVARSAVADTEGRYRLRDVPPGRHTLRVSTLDHSALEATVVVPESGGLALDLVLRLEPISLQGITVVSRPAPGPGDAAGDDPEGAGRGSPADPELRALDSTPGAAELGLADGARSEPIVDPKDPESALYVRGAASDLKLVLLDGAPVYAPFHLGGLLEAFQPGVLASARLYTGGAPARYEGGLSYILDLSSRPGRRDRFRSAGAVDNLGAGSWIEGPLAAGSFLVGGRVLHRAGTDGFIDDRLPYDYVDGLARIDLELGAGHRLAATGFLNEESVQLNEAAALNGPAHWGNAAGSLRYRGRIGGSEAEVTAALGRFTTRLPVGVEEPGVADGRSLRARLTADLMQPLGTAWLLSYGAAFDRQEIEYQARAASGTAWLDRRGVADALGAYGEAAWGAADGLTLRGGLRTNLFLSASQLRLAPRLALAWRVSDASTLSLAAGRYHQYLRVPETILSGDLSAAWSEVAVERFADPEEGETLVVAGANHLVVGLDHLPREDLRLGLEGYYKTFDGAAEVRDLRASGVDLWIDWSDGPWAAWAGYSLAWAWREGPSDPTTSDRFSARHLLSGGATLPLPSGFRVDLRLASSHGIPFTAIPIGEASRFAEAPDEGDPVGVTDRVLAGAPEGSYLRLDGQLSRTFNARLLGTRFELVPYLRVLNALDRRDALFYQFRAGEDLRPRSLEAVPLLPVLGIEWRQ